MLNQLVMVSKIKKKQPSIQERIFIKRLKETKIPIEEFKSVCDNWFT